LPNIRRLPGRGINAKAGAEANLKLPDFGSEEYDADDDDDDEETDEELTARSKPYLNKYAKYFRSKPQLDLSTISEGDEDEKEEAPTSLEANLLEEVNGVSSGPTENLPTNGDEFGKLSKVSGNEGGSIWLFLQ